MHTDKDCDFCKVLKKVMGDGGCASIGNFVAQRAVESIMRDIDLLYQNAEMMAKKGEITQEDLFTFSKLCAFSFAYAVSKVPSLVVQPGEGPLDPISMMNMVMTHIDHLDKADCMDKVDLSFPKEFN